MFYLKDTKWGEPWQVVERVQHRGVFDVPEVGSGETFHAPEFGDAFQQENMRSAVPIDNIQGDIRCHQMEYWKTM